MSRTKLPYGYEGARHRNTQSCSIDTGLRDTQTLINRAISKASIISSRRLAHTVAAGVEIEIEWNVLRAGDSQNY